MHATASQSAHRPRVLFVAEAVTLAHAARPHVLATSLAREPYDVHLAWHPRYRSLFERRPYTEHTIHSISSEAFMHALAKGRPIYEADTLHDYVNEDMRLLAAVKPDIVVGDMRLSLGISARLSGVPYVALSNAYWSPYANIHFPIPQHPLTRLLGVRAAQWLFDLARPTVFRQHARPINATRRAFGMPPLAGDLREAYTDADHTWYVDVPGQTETVDMPAHHQFLGPLSWSPTMQTPDWWNAVPSDRPIVYVSLGSSGRSDLLPVILNGLASLPVSVIAATAGREVPRHLPAHAFVARYLPGDAANKIAALTIGNGGSPITQQALAQATPVLGIASNLDQHLNMAGIVASNAGRLLRSEHVNARRIAALVASMLDDASLLQGAGRFRDEMQRYPAIERFKTMLSKLLLPSRKQSHAA